MKLSCVLFYTSTLVYAKQEESQEPISSCAKTVWQLTSIIRVSSLNVNTRTKTLEALCMSFCNLKATDFVANLRKAPDQCIISNNKCAWDLSFHGIDAVVIINTFQEIKDQDISTVHISALENDLVCFCTLFMTVNRRRLALRQTSRTSPQVSSVSIPKQVVAQDIFCQLEALSARFSISDWTAVVVRNSQFDLDAADESTDQLVCSRCETSEPPHIFLLVKLKTVETDSTSLPAIERPTASWPTVNRIEQVKKVWPSMTVWAWTMGAVLVYGVRIW